MPKTQTPKPRLVGAALCGAAAFMVLLCSLYMFASRAGGWSPALLLLLVGLGLGLAAAKSARDRGRLA